MSTSRGQFLLSTTAGGNPLDILNDRVAAGEMGWTAGMHGPPTRQVKNLMDLDWSREHVLRTAYPRF